MDVQKLLSVCYGQNCKAPRHVIVSVQTEMYFKGTV